MTTTSEVIFKAPGRICLFGDHQDYLGLPVIAFAINRFVKISAVPNKKEIFHIRMPDMKISRNISIYENFDILEYQDHLASTIRVVKRYGCIPDKGYTILITGKIPLNAGLSSSSAVVVAWVRFLLETFGCLEEISDELVAKIAYEAEVLELNSQGGKMDQYTIAIGGMIYLHTNKITDFKKIESPLKGFIIGESGIPKNTQGVLGDLKRKALQSIKIVQKHEPKFKIATATILDVEKYNDILPNELKPFFYAAVKNHEITQLASILLNEKTINYIKIGELMNHHHHVLKNFLNVTTSKIDDMIDAAINAGAFGAKIVGSGRGGSICALTSFEKQSQVINAMIKAGAKDAYPVSITS